MEARPVALPSGAAWTRTLFSVWAQRPLPTLVPWAFGSLAIGLALLGAALTIATLAGPSEFYTPVFADPSAGVNDVARIVMRNTTVLLLQVLVCFGFYVAHARGRRDALWIIGALSAYSMLSQAWRLGHDLASAAASLGLSPAALTLRLSLHAVPELTAVFLPLAACIALMRRGRHENLAAAAALTGIVAFPVVVLAATCEVFLTRYVV
jgi:hypothetical protein